VPTFRLNEAVKRNRDRFAEDFMFQIAIEEAESLTSRIAISNRTRGGRRYLPYAFTEHGVAMLSSVLNSERAIQVNILIIRAEAAGALPAVPQAPHWLRGRRERLIPAGASVWSNVLSLPVV
jgi:hypothetical protein